MVNGNHRFVGKQVALVALVLLVLLVLQGTTSYYQVLLAVIVGMTMTTSGLAIAAAAAAAKAMGKIPKP